MIEKEFIPYEQALALKELGFDESCLAWFAETKAIQIAPDVYKKWTRKPCNNSNIVKVFNVDCITTPTFSQAFRWFREKYGLKSWIREHTADTFIYEIRPHKLTDYKEGEIYVYATYEEAELECLKKLIEIVKNEK